MVFPIPLYGLQRVSRLLTMQRIEADIGGGSGVYSCWLAEQEYAAHLLDLR